MGRIVEEKDYVIKDGMLVFTESYLKKRKFCCGAQCLNCPYVPQYKKGTTKIKK